MVNRHWTIVALGAKTYPTQQDALAAAKRFAGQGFGESIGVVVYESICAAKPDGTVEVFEKDQPEEANA